MLKEFVDKIVSLAPPYFKELNGITYCDRAMQATKPPLPTALRFGTLLSLVDYVKSSLDGGDRNLAILIESPSVVQLIGPIDRGYKIRPTWATADVHEFKFPWGNWADLESFVIGLQTHFVADENTRGVLQLVGNISDGVVKNFNDDGVTQQVTAKVGISKLADVKVPNPIILAPYRTFREVAQPASPFLLRLRSNAAEGGRPQCALFEADGGAWKLEAVANVKKWLAAQLPTIDVFA